MFLLAGLAAPPAIAQDAAASGSRNSTCIISAISVAEHADSVDVEVAFNELVQPEVSRLEHPDRLVFDFPGCELAGPGQRFVVNRGPVLAVSSAALEVASPIARVVVELRSAQSRERAIAGHKLVVSLSSSGNNLVIELDANGGSRRPALAGGGNEPAANSLPLPPKSAAVVEPVPSAAPVVPGDDRAAPRTAEAVAPTPNLPPLGADRTAPRSGEVVPTMSSAPAVVPGTARAAPKFAEVAAGPLIPNLSLPPLFPRTATLQFHAYALLDKARTLTIFDLEPLEAKAEAGDPEAETTLALAYHAGTLLKQDDTQALRLLR